MTAKSHTLASTKDKKIHAILATRYPESIEFWKFLIYPTSHKSFRYKLAYYSLTMNIVKS
jgi:hypothetical protein